MTQRGRGLLEIKSSNNPFFQAASADIGTNPHLVTKWSGNTDPAMTKTSSASKDTFSFLYTRESDIIGSLVPKSNVEVKSLLTKTEFLKKRREEMRAQMLTDCVSEPEPIPRPSTEEILAHYHHAPKVEDPRFLTTSVKCSRHLL